MSNIHIGDIPLFRGLSNIELAKVLGKLERKMMQTDETLFRYGDHGESMYIVLKGNIALYIENEARERQLLTVLGEGEMLGEMALLTGEPRSATAIAAANTELYLITEESFREFIAQYPTMSAYFISLLSSRLSRTNSRLSETREAEAARIRKLTEQWADELYRPLISAALLPYADIRLLQQQFGIANIEALIMLQAGLNELLQFHQQHAQRFSFVPIAKEVLSELYMQRWGHGAKAQWLLQALDYYLSVGDIVAAGQICRSSEQENWNKLLRYLQHQYMNHAERSGHREHSKHTRHSKHTEHLKQLQQLLSPDHNSQLVQALNGCPPDKLAACPDVLLAYLAGCLELKDEAGYICFNACIELRNHSFASEQISALYVWAAEWCRQTGKDQKALEYNTLAQELPHRLEMAAANGKVPLIRLKWGGDKQQKLALQAGLLPGKRKLQVTLFLLLALLSLACFHWAEPLGSFTEQGMDFIGISIAAVMMWIIRAVPDYVVALVMAMLWVLFGVVEPAAALSGFASTSWLYMLFILALGTAIVKSGLLYRFSLLALKLFPASYRGQFLGIVASGALLNPLIPSSSGKVGLGVPLARTLSEAMGFRDRSNGMAGLSLTAMVFYGFTAPFVLTGSYTNMLALSLTEARVNWFQWFVYALPAFLLFSLIMAAFLMWIFRKQEKSRTISADVLDDQLKLLGRFTRGEKATALSTLCAVLLIMLEPVHGIDYVWIMLLGFVVLVVFGVLDEHTLKTAIDWPFLLFIGVAFSFGEVAIRTGVVAAMSEMLAGKMSFFIHSPMLFLLAVASLSFLVTLVVRDDAAVILLVVSVAPLAALASIHPWVIVFIILLATDPFFFTYQSPTYLTAYYSTEGKSFSHKQGQLVAIAYGIAVLLLAALCVPYWQWLGLIQ